MLDLLWLLIATHFLADYPLQGDYLAKTKNPYAPENRGVWVWSLSAHAMVHALMVYLVLHQIIFSIAEFFCHALIDARKCKGGLTYNQDQCLHLLYKFLWWVLFILSLPKGV